MIDWLVDRISDSLIKWLTYNYLNYQDEYEANRSIYNGNDTRFSNTDNNIYGNGVNISQEQRLIRNNEEGIENWENDSIARKNSGEDYEFDPENNMQGSRNPSLGNKDLELMRENKRILGNEYENVAPEGYESNF